MNEKKTKCGSPIDAFIIEQVLPILKDVAIALLIIVVAVLFCFRVTVVEGSSMDKTLQGGKRNQNDGDVLLLLSSTIAGAPKYGDIIVANKVSYPDPIIKRVIATEGQTVDINFQTGEVRVDDVLLDEPYISTPTLNFEGIYFPLVVDKGCVFVLGDNRGVSKDSRSPEIGLIDCREIVGKAIFLCFPGVNATTGERDYGRIGVIG